MSSYTLKSSIPDMVLKMPGRSVRVVRQTARSIEADVKLDMQKSKSGREYQRGQKIHIASAPGESPAIDTGNLINTIQCEDESGPTSYVNVHADYAARLEYGGGKIAPRPFLGPAVERAQAQFEHDLGSACFESEEVQ